MPIVIIPSGGVVTSWDEFYPLIVAHCPQVPYPEAMGKAKEACRNFFQLTNLWRSRSADLQTTSIPLLTTVAGQQLYAFTLPSGAELNRVHVAWNGTTEVLVDLPGADEDDSPAYSDTVWRIAAEGADTLRLSPIPSVSGVAVKGAVSYIPSVGATGIPKEVFDLYKYDLACGAAAMLVAQPAKPWTNPAAVMYHEQKFNAAVSKASNDAGPVRRNPLRVKAW